MRLVREVRSQNPNLKYLIEPKSDRLHENARKRGQNVDKRPKSLNPEGKRRRRIYYREYVIIIIIIIIIIITEMIFMVLSSWQKSHGGWKAEST